MARDVQRKSDLRIDQRPLLQALRRRYPQLTDADRERVAELVFQEVVKGINSGKTMAFLEIKEDGSIEVSALIVDRILSRISSGGNG